MRDLRDLVHRIVAAMPSLRPWYDQLEADDFEANIWTQLAYELVEHGGDATSPELSAIGPHLEEALLEHDAQDQVSLGFLETFLNLAEERHLDTLALRAALGPIARAVWDDLYAYLHQGDWSLVTFHPRHICDLNQGPASLVRWGVTRGAWTPSGATVAHLEIDGKLWELRAFVDCRVDRFTITGGQAIREGDLLLYLLPADYRQIRRSEPYLGLYPSDAAAAA